MFVLQTRIPTQLANNLQGMIEEYKSDLNLMQQGAMGENDENEESQVNLPAVLVFPSGRLIETMMDTIQVGFLCSFLYLLGQTNFFRSPFKNLTTSISKTPVQALFIVSVSRIVQQKISCPAKQIGGTKRYH